MKTLATKKPSVTSLVTFIVLLILTVASLILHPYIFSEESVFNQKISNNAALQGAFGKIPALIRTVQIVTTSICVNLIIGLIAKLSFSKSKRSITVTKLVCSFIKWVIIIVTIFIILDAWGVDTTAIIASAGIVTLAVSLGAQSLVADIIAGLFIVVEGEYQVGDIVVIDDWRGTVIEIGIRTTKIQDAGGNVKIVNNSEIKSIINQTQALSVAKSVVSIEYSESIPRVELVIRDNLEAIKQSIPEIIDGPFYKGVNALSQSSVDLLFLAECKEEDLYTVQRALNRELKMLFDANGIGIPFPQVTVNQPAPKSKEASKKMNAAADAFVETQTKLSRHIEEKPE